MPTDSIPGFSEKAKAAREHLGLRQVDLGDKIGVTGFRVSNWENGTSYPALAVFRAYCLALGCSADYLLGIDAPELTPEEHLLIERVRNLGPVRLRMIMEIIDHLDDLRPVDG